MEQIKAIPDRRATLIFSCVVRRMMFGAEPLVEAAMIEEKLNGDSPFMLAYAGGEICPTSVRAEGVTNRFHNYSIIACIL
jgi:small ligand-binding sensory domain FIST